MPAKRSTRKRKKKGARPLTEQQTPETQQVVSAEDPGHDARDCLQICSAVRALREQRGTTVWHPLGSGKTRIAIWTGHLLLQLGKARRVVVLVNRTALVENFKAELTRFYEQDPEVRARQLREIYAHLDGAEPEPPDAGNQFQFPDTSTDPSCFTLPSTAITDDPALLADQGPDKAWFVCTLQKMYSAFQHQRPPPFHLQGIPAQRVRLPSSRKYKEQFAKQIFGESFVILDEAHQLRAWRSWKPRACDDDERDLFTFRGPD